MIQHDAQPVSPARLRPHEPVGLPVLCATTCKAAAVCGALQPLSSSRRPTPEPASPPAHSTHSTQHIHTTGLDTVLPTNLASESVPSGGIPGKQRSHFHQITPSMPGFPTRLRFMQLHSSVVVQHQEKVRCPMSDAHHPSNSNQQTGENQRCYSNATI